MFYATVDCVLSILFLPVNVNKFNEVFGESIKEQVKVVEDKIAEIKKEESDKINKNNKMGERLKDVTWYKEIFITVVLVLVVYYILG